MRRTKNSSSSPPELIRVPIERLRPHPANANVMSEERLEKLARNIAREGRYPPVIVRPHPDGSGDYQIIDGHQRVEVAGRLGEAEVLCFPWPCDDETALLLLATLNRLEGEDVPLKRAGLLQQLSTLLPPEELALLLPEDAGAITDTLGLLELDAEKLMAELTQAAERVDANLPRTIAFAVSAEDEQAIEEAIRFASLELEGENRRGRALGMIARAYLESRDA